jgi:3-oxoacyl-[acyl-carrier protein] reductase
MTRLAGRTALVTGASRGLGRASALALAGMGAQVLVHYSSGVKEAEAVVAEIRKAGGRADAVAADLSAQDGPHKLARRSAQWSATGWTSSSPMPASRSRRPSEMSYE